MPPPVVPMSPFSHADSRALAFTGAGFSFAAIVGGLTYGGWWLDEWLSTEPWMVCVGALLGVALGTWDLIATVTALEKSSRTRNGR